MNATQLINDWQQQGSTLKVAGANSYIWRIGQGEPVVCIHGVPTSGFLYRNVLAELERHGFEGITLDLPGLGLADRPRDFDYSWHSLSEWYVNALDAAGIQKFHLVVHDIGGPIGFDLIRRIPDRIKSLTVLNTIVNVSSFHRPWSMEPFAWPAIGQFWLQSAHTPLYHLLLKLQGMHHVNRALAKAYSRLLLGEDKGAAFLKIMRGFERTSAFENGIKTALANRKFPAQIIWGKQDPTLTLKKYLPDLLASLNLSDYKTVHGKHFLQEDSAEEIAQYISNFIQSCNHKSGE